MIFFIKLKNSKAFSLLEIMVSLGLFTFLFLFITQIVRQNYRQTAKIKTDLEVTGSIYPILNLIKQDLFAATYFLDLSYNFNTHFPVKSEESDKKDHQTPALDSTKANKHILLDSEIVFKGTERDMEFVSYSFSKNSRFKQWMKIRYAVEACSLGNTSGSCLMRYEQTGWNLYEELKWDEPALVVIEGAESIKFLYSNNYDLVEPNWVEKWESETKAFKIASSGLSQESPEELPLPARVQIYWKNKDSSPKVWELPVSKIRFKEWSPYLKGLRSFEIWTPPKKTDPNKKT